MLSDSTRDSGRALTPGVRSDAIEFSPGSAWLCSISEGKAFALDIEKLHSSRPDSQAECNLDPLGNPVRDCEK